MQVRKILLTLPAIAGALAALYWSSLVNYLLFHSLIEIFSIVVAFSLFMIVWNSRHLIESNYLLFIGIAYLFIGFLDLLHTLSYKGMNIFPDYDYYANQLWIAARGLESLTLLFGFFLTSGRRRIKAEWVFAAFFTLTCIAVLSIFHWKIFPECFIEGQGLTPFKKISEYVICLVLIAALLLLVRNRGDFDRGIFRMIFASIVFTILSEVAFTYYISNYGLSNLVGHYFKLFSFFLVYRAILVTGIKTPYDLIFRELKSKEKELEEQASMDPLTEIYNRRMGFNLLEKCLRRTAREKESMTLCFLDIDGLKAINDNLGHLEGDRAIRAAARILSESIRQSDCVCRFAGDEFLLIFQNCGRSEAEKVVGRAVEKAEHFNQSSPFRLEFSIGFSEFLPGDPLDVDRLVEMADNEMYRDKERKKSSPAPGSSESLRFHPSNG